MKINTLYNNSKDYPNKLNQLFKPPQQLYYRGDLPKERICIAIVGTRKPTEYGRNVVKYIIDHLADLNVSIISGLAYGIDSLAHQFSLQNSLHTTAVLPGSLKHIYPSRHLSLARKIAENGCLISETEDTDIFKHSFLQRNRIIAALSDLTIVVEAASRSGAINTAMHALELGREVMAVPGSIFSHYSHGTNSLIKNGAVPLCSINDIYNLLNLEKKEPVQFFKNQDQAKIYETIKNSGPLDISQLINKCGLPPSETLSILTELELEGKLRTQQGRYFI